MIIVVKNITVNSINTTIVKLPGNTTIRAKV